MSKDVDFLVDSSLFRVRLSSELIDVLGNPDTITVLKSGVKRFSYFHKSICFGKYIVPSSDYDEVRFYIFNDSVIDRCAIIR